MNKLTKIKQIVESDKQLSILLSNFANNHFDCGEFEGFGATSGYLVLADKAEKSEAAIKEYIAQMIFNFYINLKSKDI